MELSFFGFLGIFVSGLALNLTPCVYPMLSVTVALFGSKQERRAGDAFLKAVVYVAGIATMYSLLGVAAAYSGKIFGAFLQNPWILGLISLAMLALALSMFGFYYFQLPSQLLERVTLMKKVGLAGVFLSGLCVAIFAAPCIGPPIVAMFALVGQTGNPMTGFLIFFVMSLGLGVPYLFLGAFSGLLEKLPRSGEWLVWVKKSFGVIMLGFAAFYALLALGQSEHLLPIVLPLILMGGGIYLGFIEKSGNKNAAFLKLKQVLGIFAVIIGSSLFLVRPVEGVAWEAYSPEKIEQAIQDKKPVVIDFFADWCIPCHELDQYTYTDKNVMQALEPFVRLKVDVTNPKTPDAVAPIERFNVIGVPTILFLDREGKEVTASRITGFVGPKDFLEAMKPLLSANEAEEKAV